MTLLLHWHPWHQCQYSVGQSKCTYKHLVPLPGCGELNAASAIRNCSLGGVRQQLQQLMEKHEKEVRKQQEEASKLKGATLEHNVGASSKSLLLWALFLASDAAR